MVVCNAKYIEQNKTRGATVGVDLKYTERTVPSDIFVDSEGRKISIATLAGIIRTKKKGLAVREKRAAEYEEQARAAPQGSSRDGNGASHSSNWNRKSKIRNEALKNIALNKVRNDKNDLKRSLIEEHIDACPRAPADGLVRISNPEIGDNLGRNRSHSVLAGGQLRDKDASSRAGSNCRTNASRPHGDRSAAGRVRRKQPLLVGSTQSSGALQ